jgi:hypothetical protein
MVDIRIANDYTRHPGGRYSRLGKFSGERFRDEFLIPSLNSEEQVQVYLDGTAGYGSSFLEEAFGGLIRNGFDLISLERRLKIIAEDPEFETYVHEVWQYIREEAERKLKA